MTAYYRDDRGQWYVDFTIEYPDGDKKRVRRSSNVNTRRGAERFERELTQQMLREWRDEQLGIDLDDAPPFAEFATEFLQWCDGNVKKSTRNTYASTIDNHLTPAFKSMKIDEIDARGIERLKAKMARKGLTAKSIRNYLGVLSKMLTLAEEWRMIRAVPTIRPPSVKREKTDEFEFWDFEEAARVLEQVDTEPRIANIIRLALATGLRQGELCGLKWGDIDMKKRVVTVRRQFSKGRISTPKSNELRRVPLSDDALEALRAQKPKTYLRARGEEDWVFVDDYGLFSYNRIRDGFFRIVRRAEVTRISFHGLRHTFASHAVMNGVPIEVLQRWLGHSDIRVTQRYAHLAPGFTDEFIQLMNDRPDSGAEDHQ